MHACMHVYMYIFFKNGLSLREFQIRFCNLIDPIQASEAIGRINQFKKVKQIKLLMLEILSQFHFHEEQKTGNEKIKKHNYLELYNENKYLCTLIWQERNYC